MCSVTSRNYIFMLQLDTWAHELNHVTHLSVVGYEHYLLPSGREEVVEQL